MRDPLAPNRWLLVVLAALGLSSCDEAPPWPSEHCGSGVCNQCLFGGEEVDGFCVAPEYEPADEPLDLSDLQAHRADIVLRTMSPLRIGMSTAAATAAVGSPPVHDQEVTFEFGQIGLDGVFQTLAWERDVRFLEAPLSLYGNFADDRLVAVWLDASRRDQHYAVSIPPTSCNDLTDFIVSRYGPEGTIVQLPSTLFDHSTNVYATSQPTVWREEARNMNVISDENYWIGYSTVFEIMSDFNRNGRHYDHLEGCRSEFVVAERR